MVYNLQYIITRYTIYLYIYIYLFHWFCLLCQFQRPAWSHNQSLATLGTSQCPVLDVGGKQYELSTHAVMHNAFENYSSGKYIMITFLSNVSPVYIVIANTLPKTKRNWCPECIILYLVFTNADIHVKWLMSFDRRHIKYPFLPQYRMSVETFAFPLVIH